jgi:Heterokaryon incompatibility protein (HET)
MKALPTRVIDVGLPEASTEPRLIISNGRDGAYITLSHCWGVPDPSKPPLLTTAANLSAMIKEIPLESMPLNYRDAVVTTRKLSFRYLWIDSLCIIQDSVEDWEAESAKMGEVYQNAQLTIAALVYIFEFTL